MFFDSVSRHWQKPGVAVILSGMGKDGAEGMLSLRKGGWYTIAQDEATCAVYGMPKAAISRNAIINTSPVDEIAETVVAKLLSTMSPPRNK